MVFVNTFLQVETTHKKLVLIIRLMPHQGKKLMDIEFAMDLMVTYSVDKAYFGKGRSGFDPDFKHLYTHVNMQRD
jgi:hypothetical protein